MKVAYEHFRARVESGEDTAIDPYAAESPAEFFAVLSEVFFAEPALLLHEYAECLRSAASLLPSGPGAPSRAADGMGPRAAGGRSGAQARCTKLLPAGRAWNSCGPGACYLANR